MDGKRVFLFPGLIPGRCRDLRHGGVGSGTLRKTKGPIGVSQSPAPPPTLRRQEVAGTQHNPVHLWAPWEGEHSRGAPMGLCTQLPGSSEPAEVWGCSPHLPLLAPLPCSSSLIIVRLSGRRCQPLPPCLPRPRGCAERRAHTDGDTRQMRHPALPCPTPLVPGSARGTAHPWGQLSVPKLRRAPGPPPPCGLRR